MRMSKIVKEINMENNGNLMYKAIHKIMIRNGIELLIKLINL